MMWILLRIVPTQNKKTNELPRKRKAIMVKEPYIPNVNQMLKKFNREPSFQA
jgi:hypothetical protein